MEKGKKESVRAAVYLSGIVMVSLGIILCKKATLEFRP